MSLLVCAVYHGSEQIQSNFFESWIVFIFFCSASASVYCAVRGDFSFVLHFFLIKVIVSNWREQTESFALSLSHVGAAVSQPKLFILLMESTGESHQKNLRMESVGQSTMSIAIFHVFFFYCLCLFCVDTQHTQSDREKNCSPSALAWSCLLSCWFGANAECGRSGFTQWWHIFTRAICFLYFWCVLAFIAHFLQNTVYSWIRCVLFWW